MEKATDLDIILNGKKGKIVVNAKNKCELCDDLGYYTDSTRTVRTCLRCLYKRGAEQFAN